MNNPYRIGRGVGRWCVVALVVLSMLMGTGLMSESYADAGKKDYVRTVGSPPNRAMVGRGSDSARRLKKDTPPSMYSYCQNHW